MAEDFQVREVVVVKGLLTLDTTKRLVFRSESREIELRWRSGLFLHSILNSPKDVRELDVSEPKIAQIRDSARLERSILRPTANCGHEMRAGSENPY